MPSILLTMRRNGKKSFPAATDYNNNPPKIQYLFISCRFVGQAARQGVRDKWQLSRETGRLYRGH